jgi:hypothetical protein
MTFTLRLTHDEPRLVFLALVYHLARPGSELDADTLAPSGSGLRDVKVALGSQVYDASALIELDQQQYRKLLSAIYGSVNELRVLHMRGDSGSVPRFRETARQLFPAMATDPDSALDVAEAMMLLHRRLERAVGRAAVVESDGTPRSRESRRWPFRRVKR